MHCGLRISVLGYFQIQEKHTNLFSYRKIALFTTDYSSCQQGIEWVDEERKVCCIVYAVIYTCDAKNMKNRRSTSSISFILVFGTFFLQTLTAVWMLFPHVNIYMLFPRVNINVNHNAVLVWKIKTLQASCLFLQTRCDIKNADYKEKRMIVFPIGELLDVRLKIEELCVGVMWQSEMTVVSQLHS